MSDVPSNTQLPVIKTGMSCACKWRIGALLAVCLVVAGCVVAWWWQSFEPDPSSRLPVVTLDEVGPGVRRAIQDATELVKRKPRSGPSWGRLGMVLLAHNFEDAAETCFAVARQLDPKAVRWAYYAGVGQAVIDPSRAEAYFQQAVELAPADAWPKFRLAELLMDLHQLDRAELLLESLDAGQQETRLNYDQVRLAMLHKDKSRLQKIDDRQLQALRAGTNRRACLELLAQVYHRLGRGPEAAAIRQSLRTESIPAEGWDDPYVAEVFQLRQDPNWLASLARNDLRAGRTDQAVRQLQGLIDDYPDDPQWPIELSRVWSQLKQPAKALQVLESAVEQHPKAAPLHFEVGNLQFAAGHWQEATQAYARATRFKADYALAYYNLGQSLLKLKRDKDAISAFRCGLQSQPDLAPALINLADLLSRSGQPADLAEARQHLQRALKVAPQDRRANELLERLPKQ